VACRTRKGWQRCRASLTRIPLITCGDLGTSDWCSDGGPGKSDRHTVPPSSARKVSDPAYP